MNPFPAQQTPFRGHMGPNRAKRQAKKQTVPKLVLSINLGNGTFWGPYRGTGAGFWLFWAILGPCGSPPGAYPGHGHLGAWSTLAAETRAFWVPKVIVCRPNTIPDSVVTFTPGFGTPVALGPSKGPKGLACCLLLLAC